MLSVSELWDKGEDGREGEEGGTLYDKALTPAKIRMSGCHERGQRKKEMDG